MHIKQIIIKGFKTYKDQIIVGPLSPKDNVFVGLNGHGKSNFFSAIMFVLSDKFSNIRAEEKNRLIHEGSSEQVEEASVEIILDNSANRLPVDRSTVSIKRRLKGGKDEYYLDGKNVTKLDIGNLLESAGFSRSNPYYIVQQGRVASLAAMTETQTFELLKEVAGTKLFEEKKAESDRMLEDTKRQRAKLQEVLEIIEGRIFELNMETEDLKKYVALDKSKRGLEYVLYKYHVLEAQTDLENLENEQVELIEKMNNVKVSKDDLTEDIEQKEGALECLNLQHQKTLNLLQALECELSTHTHSKEVIERQIQNIQTSRSSVFNNSENLNQELRSLFDEEQSELAKIEALQPRFQHLNHQEALLKENIADLQGQKNAMMAKQASMLRFKSIKERNAFLDKEIRGLTGLLRELEDKLRSLEEENFTLQKKMAGKTDVAEQSALKTEVEECVGELSHIKQARVENITQLSTLKGEEESVEGEIEQFKVKQNALAHRLQVLLPHALFTSIERLRSECMHIPGFYGLLLDLIEVPPKLMTCMDAAGKLKGFSMIVDTFETAKRVIEINKKFDGGSISIYPSEWFPQLQAPNRSYPESSDCLVLLSQIKVSEKCPIDLSPLLRSLFGKVLLVRNLETANKFAKEWNLNCVTPGGQIVFAGAYMVRAGFHDTKKERIRNYYEYSKVRKELDGLKETVSRLKLQKDECMSKDTHYLRRIQEILLQKEAAQNKLNNFRAAEQQLGKERTEMMWALGENSKAIEGIKVQTVEVKNSIELARSEKNRKDIGNLNSQEEHTLNAILDSIDVKEKELMRTAKEKMQLQAELQESQLKISSLFPEKKQIIEQQMEDHKLFLESKDLGELQEDLNHVSKLMADIEVQVKASIQQRNDMAARERETTSKLTELKQKEMAILNELSSLQMNSEKLNMKYAHFCEIKEDYAKKMANLGMLSPEELGKYSQVPVSDLMVMIDEHAKSLENYRHVNKRALDLHSKSIEKIEMLKTRIQEIDDSQVAIEDLISHLDKIKDEAVIRTFRTVNQNFSEVFNELVPSGKGVLKMIKDEGSGVDQYIGISICVSFSKNEETFYKMQQLSGGQKTAVAIALVIAIQRTDPAPFYLFDELDAALDTQFRASLAKVVARSSDRAQFIMTTFKPELCKNANKIFEVKFNNRCSSIKQIDRDRGLEVINNANQPN